MPARRPAVADPNALLVDLGKQYSCATTAALREERRQSRLEAGEPIRAIGYIRVSKRDAREGESYQTISEIQRPQLELQARKESMSSPTGFDIVEWVIHEDKKGNEIARLRYCWERIEQGDADVLLVKNVQRFARSARHAMNALYFIVRVGGDVISVEGHSDVHTPTGRMLFTNLAAIGEMELERFTENFAVTRRNAHNRGVAGHPIPFGYRRGGENGKGPYIPDPETAPVLRRIFKLRTEGYGPHVIARLLNEEGVVSTNGGSWGGATVRYLLQNETYLGWLVEKGQETNYTAHEPLVSAEEWHLAQSVPLTSSRGAGPRRSYKTRDYPLAGLLICAHCSSSMAGTYCDKNGRRYQCTAAPCSLNHSLVASKLEALAAESVRRFAEEQLGGTFEPVDEERSAAYDQLVTERRDAEADLDILQENMAMLLRHHGADAYAAQVEQVKQELTRLASEEQRLLARRADLDVHRIAESWDSLNVHEQQQMYKAAFGGILIRSRKAIPGRILQLEDRLLVMSHAHVRRLDDLGLRPRRGKPGHLYRPIPWGPISELDAVTTSQDSGERSS